MVKIAARLPGPRDSHQMAVGGRPRGHQIGGFQVDVVEHVGDETVGHGGGRASGRGGFIAFLVECGRDHGQG